MKILSERASVLADVEHREITILMDGFRMTLSGEDACALYSSLAKGMNLLFPVPHASRPPAAQRAPDDTGGGATRSGSPAEDTAAAALGRAVSA